MISELDAGAVPHRKIAILWDRIITSRSDKGPLTLEQGHCCDLRCQYVLLCQIVWLMHWAFVNSEKVIVLPEIDL